MAIMCHLVGFSEEEEEEAHGPRTCFPFLRLISFLSAEFFFERSFACMDGSLSRTRWVPKAISLTHESNKPGSACNPYRVLKTETGRAKPGSCSPKITIFFSVLGLE